MSLQELAQAVQTLPADDFRQFSAWFDEWRAEQWDQQIAADASAGRLDSLYQSLQHENEGHVYLPLDEVLNEEKLL